MKTIKHLMKSMFSIGCIVAAIMLMNPMTANAAMYEETTYVSGRDPNQGLITQIIDDDNITLNGDYAFYIVDGFLKSVSPINVLKQDGNVVIPNTVKVIDSNAITGQNKDRIDFPIITSLTIPNTVTAIDANAISRTQITELTIPSSVKYIGVNGVAYNKKLTTLTIEEGCTHIDMNAFKGCTSLKTAYLPSTIKKMSYNWTDQNPFNGIEKKVTVYAKKGSFVYGYCKNILGMKVVNTTPTKPAAVSSFKASSVKTNSLKLSWKKAKNASVYYIYQSTNGKSWSKLTETKETSYSVINLTPAKAYKFKIVPVNVTKTGTAKGNSKTISASTKTVTPTLASVTRQSKKKALLTFDKQKTSKYYEVYASTNKKKLKKVATFKNSKSGKTSYVLSKGLKAGKTNYVKIRCYTTVNGKKVYSGYSKVIKVKM